MDRKIEALVASVDNEISRMQDQRMLKRYPSGAVQVRGADLPAPVRELFLGFVGSWLQETRAIREGDDESFDPREEMELTFHRGLLEGSSIWWVGMHDPTSPVNPSGYDFYARDDGTFVGWTES